MFPGSERMSFTSFRSGSVRAPFGLGSANARSWISFAQNFAGPPKSLLRLGEFSEKRDLSVGEIWAPKIAPTLRGKKNPITRWGPPVLRLIRPKLVYHCVLFTLFSFFSPKSILFSEFLTFGVAESFGYSAQNQYTFLHFSPTFCLSFFR